LVDHLKQKYDPDHEIILYEAAQYPTFNPIIEKILLKHLPKSTITRLTTLYIPPSMKKKPDTSMLLKLNLNK
jgi:hypothetical protein